MSSNTKWLVDWRGELNNLVVILQVPKSDGTVAGDGDYVALWNVEVH
jgi:hypothetical protein